MLTQHCWAEQGPLAWAGVRLHHQAARERGAGWQRYVSARGTPGGVMGCAGAGRMNTIGMQAGRGHAGWLILLSRRTFTSNRLGAFDIGMHSRSSLFGTCCVQCYHMLVTQADAQVVGPHMAAGCLLGAGLALARGTSQHAAQPSYRIQTAHDIQHTWQQAARGPFRLMPPPACAPW